MKRFFFIPPFFLLLLFCKEAVAQINIFKTYSVSDGLVSNNVRTIYQDSDGFLWIATWEGLSRYDGYKFTNFTTANGFSHNMINDVVEAGPGVLYVAANNGDIYSISHKKAIKKEALSGTVVNRFHKTTGNKIWGATDSHGIVELSESKLKPLFGTGHVSIHDFIQQDSSFFAAVDKYGIASYRGGIKKSSLPDNGLVAWRILKDKAGRIWLCTHRGLKIVRFENGLLKYAPLPNAFKLKALTGAEIKDIYEWEDGTLWFASSQGLVIISPDGKSKILTREDGLPSSTITCFFRDREKNLWIGTTVGFVRVRNTMASSSLSFLPVKSNSAVSVYRHLNNDIVLFNEESIAVYKSAEKKWKPIFTGLPRQQFALVKGSTPLTLISQTSVIQFDTGLTQILSNKKIAITGYLFNAIQTGSNILIGTNRGLVLYNGDSVVRIPDFNYRITGFAKDSNNCIWIGTWNDGIFCARWDDHRKELNFENHPAAQMVSEKQIRSLFIDNEQKLWVGTRYNGALCMQQLKNGSWQKAVYNQEAGMVSNWALNFEQDEKGNIWVAGHTGIIKLIPSGQHYRIFNYSRINNYFPAATSLANMGNNHLIVGTYSGLDEINDEAFENNAPLPVLLTHIEAGPYITSDTLPATSLKLNHNENTARFEFSSPGFINEKELLYSYRLVGSGDTSWSKPINIHAVQYASLQPGDYHFEVRNIAWSGKAGTPKSFHFIISPPYWQRWWFYGLVTALAALIFFIAYRYRVAQIIRLQKVRNSIATDLHDDIGSALTNISILAELSRNKNQQKEFAENLPARIAEESTLAQQALDDIIWSVNSNNDSLNQTMARMRRYAAEVFEPIGINCNIDFGNAPGDVKLNMEQRKDIYLVFKECLNNIIKHAAAKNAFIKIDVGKNVFQLTIKDDGKGFDPLKQTDRNGLKNIKARIERWKGKFHINSASGKGTVIDCNFPLASPK